MLNLKFSSLSLAVFLLSFTINGCKKIVGSFPPRYVLNFTFKDQEGNDLLSNIKEDDIKTDITISSSEGEILTSTIEVLKFNNTKYLKIDLSSRPDVYLKQISYTINNKILIGNTEERKIITQWHLVKNNNEVKLLKFNGKIIDQRNEPIIHYELVHSD